MGHYKNFTVDFPQRLGELDQRFLPIASEANLEVSYVLMKLAAAFLLPYERLEGTSGARTGDVDPMQRHQSIRRVLELDKRFFQASYCGDRTKWFLLDVVDFSRGPKQWQGAERSLESPVHEVLEGIRHSVAHSNLFFGGERQIEHVYLGSRKEKLPETGKYRVIRCTVNELGHLVDAWIRNVQKLRVSPALIWRELETAA